MDRVSFMSLRLECSTRESWFRGRGGSFPPWNHPDCVAWSSRGPRFLITISIIQLHQRWPPFSAEGVLSRHRGGGKWSKWRRVTPGDWREVELRSVDSRARTVSARPTVFTYAPATERERSASFLFARWAVTRSLPLVVSWPIPRLSTSVDKKEVHLTC